MTGYQYRAQTAPPVTGIKLLSRVDLARMTPEARDRRRAHWKGIIRGLQLEHERIYHAHSPVETRTLCGLDGCDQPVSRGGLCARDYMRQYRSKKRGEAA